VVHLAEKPIKQKREEYVRALDSAFIDVLAQLSQIPEVEKVILFGSYAAGRRDLFTDLDLLVVMDSELDFVHRTAEMYARIHTNVDMDLLVYTPEEFVKNKENGFIRQALATGQVVYEKTAA
jgi:predicted nucleotidyltransferase